MSPVIIHRQGYPKTGDGPGKSARTSVGNTGGNRRSLHPFLERITASYMSPIEKLNTVLHYVKHSFVGKDEIVDLLGISLLARENLFLLGPPGTAKSAIVRLLSSCVEDGKNFEYLLTRFTEPNEIFGPFDIRKLKDGELITNTEGMMPEASMVFL